MLQVNRATLKQVKKFKYLRVAFTSDGRQDEELDTRIGKASAVMRALHYLGVMKRELLKKAKLSIFKTVFVPILTYGQGWQSHGIDDFLRYLLRRKTAMRFCDAMQSRITYTIFFAII